MNLPHTPPRCPLILASTSPYRYQLLTRLRLPFTTVAPDVAEARLPDEAPAQMARRLALAKASAVAAMSPGSVVIGSDQVADWNGTPLYKPGSHAAAVAQLQAVRGQTIVFQTAVSVVCRATGFEQTDLAQVTVKFQNVSDAQIEAYLRTEMPYDCVGSAKSEGLGIALLESVDSDDPTALVGLPLIRTCRLLEAAGIQVLPPQPPAAS